MSTKKVASLRAWHQLLFDAASGVMDGTMAAEEAVKIATVAEAAAQFARIDLAFQNDIGDEQVSGFFPGGADEDAPKRVVGKSSVSPITAGMRLLKTGGGK